MPQSKNPLAGLGSDSNWVVAGFADPASARRQVHAFLRRGEVSALDSLGVSVARHDETTLVVFDSVLPWPPPTDSAPAHDVVTTGLTTAFPGHEIYYTHDMVGFGLATGDLCLQHAIDAGEAVLVSRHRQPR